MPSISQPYCFQQLHIDVARNATDDFNLFHDPHKWHNINNNPFEGPIVLGFQLESLLEGQIWDYRKRNNEQQLIDQNNLHFSHYDLNFANAVKPGQTISIDIKSSRFREQQSTKILSNRVTVKTNGKLALMGFQSVSQKPLILTNKDFSDLGDLRQYADRSEIPGTSFFLKRKFMNTSNAKNFLCGSFIDQSQFFDELNDKADFPEIFPSSLISCALLERALRNHHDFEQNPMVYTSHKIAIDRRLLKKLKSNHALHILVAEIPEQEDTFECYGLVKENAILFRGIISLVSLEKILK